MTHGKMLNIPPDAFHECYQVSSEPDIDHR